MTLNFIIDIIALFAITNSGSEVKAAFCSSLITINPITIRTRARGIAAAADCYKHPMMLCYCSWVALPFCPMS
ncbi:MAG: hypothetical protein WAJ93_03520 [Candidatus Nitrosopolaris sp.]